MSALPLSNSVNIIRKACKEDGEEIFKIASQAFADYRSGSNPRLKETIFDIHYDLAQNTILVIEKEDSLVGSLRLEFKDDGGVYLKRFSILPDYQHQGLGTNLYNWAEGFVSANDGEYIYLYSSIEDQKLITFYEKLGFICIETDDKYGYKRGLWVKKIRWG